MVALPEQPQVGGRAAHLRAAQVRSGGAAAGGQRRWAATRWLVAPVGGGWAVELRSGAPAGPRIEDQLASVVTTVGGGGRQLMAGVGSGG